MMLKINLAALLVACWAVAAFRLLMDRMHDPSAAPAHKVLPFVLEKNSSTR